MKSLLKDKTNIKWLNEILWFVGFVFSAFI